MENWIPVSSTGMTPFIVSSHLLYGLAAILNGYMMNLSFFKSSVSLKL
ncbi:MAG: hypothetical protein ACEY3B_06020 [Wolbachia sp.]